MKVYPLILLIIYSILSVSKCVDQFSGFYTDKANSQSLFESSPPNVIYSLASESNPAELSWKQSLDYGHFSDDNLLAVNKQTLETLQSSPRINSIFENTWENPSWRRYLRKFSRTPPVIRYRQRNPIPAHSVIDPHTNSGQFPVPSRQPLNRDPMYAIPAPPTGFRQSNPQAQHGVQPEHDSMFHGSSQRYNF